MADHKMQWFPVDAVDLLTDERFTALTLTELGALFKIAAHYWIHGRVPVASDSQPFASGSVQAAIDGWLVPLYAAQKLKFERLSERNSQNATSRHNKDLHATGSDSQATRKRLVGVRTYREGDGEGKQIEKKTTATTPRFAPPAWIPGDAWSGFLEMRRGKKAPNTDRALSGIVKDLETYKAAGDDPGAVLDQSTKRGWTGVFPIRAEGNGGKSRMPTKERFLESLKQTAARDATPIGGVRDETNF